MEWATLVVFYGLEIGVGKSFSRQNPLRVIVHQHLREQVHRILMSHILTLRCDEASPRLRRESIQDLVEMVIEFEAIP